MSISKIKEFSKPIFGLCHVLCINELFFRFYYEGNDSKILLSLL